MKRILRNNITFIHRGRKNYFTHSKKKEEFFPNHKKETWQTRKFNDPTLFFFLPRNDDDHHKPRKDENEKKNVSENPPSPRSFLKNICRTHHGVFDVLDRLQEDRGCG